MLIAPVLWSTAGVVTRHIQHAAAFEQVFWRSLFAFAFVFFAITLKKENPLKLARKAGAPGLVSGAMWAIMFTAFVIALSLTSIANTLVVMSVGPLLTSVLAWLVLKEDIASRTWAAAVAAAIGIGWMAASDFGAHGARDVAGMLVALFVPFAAATNVVVLRASHARVDLIPAVMLGGLASCLVALPLALPLQASGRDLALLAFLGFFQLGVPCMLLVIASRTLPAPEIALLGLLEVLLGPLWAWLFAGETPGSATLVGGGIVLSALLFNELRGFRRIIASKLL
jgi:drug/metabolite transporter (DMT)-like permease